MGNHTVTNHTSANIGDVNPFRYRGYYYDVETNFYYLNSRYYDPEIKRFISADSIDVIGTTPDGLTDKNLYAYCDNNPVMRTDNGGEFWNVLAGTIVGAAVGLVSSVVSEIIEGEFDWKDLGQIAISTAIGAAEGALVATFPVAAPLISGLASAGESAIMDVMDGKSKQEIAINSLVSGTVGAVAGMQGADFVKGGKLLNSEGESIGNAIRKGVHPTVKKTAKKIVKKAKKFIVKTYVSGQAFDLAYWGISEGASWYINKVFERVGG